MRRVHGGEGDGARLRGVRAIGLCLVRFHCVRTCGTRSICLRGARPCYPSLRREAHDRSRLLIIRKDAQHKLLVRPSVHQQDGLPALLFILHEHVMVERFQMFLIGDLEKAREQSICRPFEDSGGRPVHHRGGKSDRLDLLSHDLCREKGQAIAEKADQDISIYVRAGLAPLCLRLFLHGKRQQVRQRLFLKLRGHLERLAPVDPRAVLRILEGRRRDVKILPPGTVTEGMGIHPCRQSPCVEVRDLAEGLSQVDPQQVFFLRKSCK